MRLVVEARLAEAALSGELSIVDLSGLPREARYEQNDRAARSAARLPDHNFFIWLGPRPDRRG